MADVSPYPPEIALDARITDLEKTEIELPIPPFDPAIHLNYQPPASRHTFTELGLPVPKGCPDMCFTDPFQMFSEEGVRMIRREAFRRSFLDKYLKTYGEKEYIIIRGCGNVKGVSFGP